MTHPLQNDGPRAYAQQPPPPVRDTVLLVRRAEPAPDTLPLPGISAETRNCHNEQIGWLSSQRSLGL